MVYIKKLAKKTPSVCIVTREAVENGVLQKKENILKGKNRVDAKESYLYNVFINI